MSGAYGSPCFATIASQSPQMFPGIPIPDGERCAHFYIFCSVLHFALASSLFVDQLACSCHCCSHTYIVTHTRMLIRHLFVLAMRKDWVHLNVAHGDYMCDCDVHVIVVHVLRATLAYVCMCESVCVCVATFHMVHVTPHTCLDV